MHLEPWVVFNPSPPRRRSLTLTTDMDGTLLSSSTSDYQWYSDSLWPKLIDTDPFSFLPLEYGFECLEPPAER